MAFGPPAMGYDRAITVFSPDGKLYQVEYAAENIKKGWTTIGIKSKNGGVLAAEKRKIAPLIDMNSIEKIYLIDTHIGASFAGLAADGRVLIDYARRVAMNYRFIYDEPIDVELVVRNICDIKQLYTQHAGVRPFGVSLIFLGVDKRGVQLFKTEINGYYFAYLALAMGSGEQPATEQLEKNYSKDLSVSDMIKLALKALRVASEQPLRPDLVEMGYIDVETKTFRKLSNSELAEWIKKAGVDK
ncbi:MAG: proteasome endopeptidase complex, archaeal, alpha subunit [Thermoprotei archaeon]|nr:MAG: proteasome endopeptidase complex, archaeal, alpha subunit [Thermoprotei archaeon]